VQAHRIFFSNLVVVLLLLLPLTGQMYFVPNQQEDTLPDLLFESQVWGWPVLTVILSKM
jgi:hypothetical protein